MSNKTQLQANNTSLDALIERVNAAKDTAASLPEAGSGGSGGTSVETCTFTVLEYGPCSASTATVIFSLPDGSVYNNSGTMLVAGTTLTIAKNSLAVTNYELCGEAAIIENMGYEFVWHVTGDVYMLCDM